MTSGDDRLMSLAIPLPDRGELAADLQAAFNYLEKEHGLLPNVLRAYTFDPGKLRPFMDLYNSIMLHESELSLLEREMIGVTVSSANRCVYCLTAHGAAVRGLSGDPVLGERLAMNHRSAVLPARQRAMLDLAVKLTRTPEAVVEADRESLRSHGFSERAIWDIVSVTALFNFTNRMAAGADIVPNREYNHWFRDARG